MSSAMAIDQSLDNLIAEKKKARRSSTRKAPAAGKKRLSSAKTAKKGKAAIVGSSAAAAPVSTVATQPSLASKATKINVSNLPVDVKETEIRELFSSTVGPLRSLTLHHDAQGKSKGMATVVFNQKGDASKALTQYNNRLIDGSRKMKIELVLEAIPALAAPTLTQRVAPAPAAAGAAATAGTSGSPAKTARKVGRKGRPARKGKKVVRPAVSAADLDAQMEDYTSSAQPQSTAAA